MKVTKVFISVLLAALVFMSLNAAAQDSLRLATTTSTENTGLLAVLNPVFEKQYGVRVDVLAMGTGKALKTGSKGDVDVVLVHAPAAELEYIAQGHFVDRTAIMHNDFIIVGAKEDPAKIASATSVEQAFLRIVESQSAFVSRGDDSGTHKKELSLWADIALTPNRKWAAWYAEAGQGMAAILRIADNKQAYTLTDRGTYLAYAEKISLQLLFEDKQVLFNPYHVMAVNPDKHSDVQYKLAKKYIQFLSGKQGQAIIANFQKAGQPLFIPDAN